MAWLGCLRVVAMPVVGPWVRLMVRLRRAAKTWATLRVWSR